MTWTPLLFLHFTNLKLLQDSSHFKSDAFDYRVRITYHYHSNVLYSSPHCNVFSCRWVTLMTSFLPSTGRSFDCPGLRPQSLSSGILEVCPAHHDSTESVDPGHGETYASKGDFATYFPVRTCLDHFYTRLVRVWVGGPKPVGRKSRNH